jgi:hypothetical protein
MKIADASASLKSNALSRGFQSMRELYLSMDPRLPVGLILFTYLALGMTVLGFNRTPMQAAVTTLSAAALELALGRVFRRRWFFPWSAIITSMGLSILLNYSHNYVLLLVPVFFAIGTKYLFTFNGRHALNPALAGVAFSLILSRELITAAPAYQWMGIESMAIFIIALALVFVMPKANRTWLVGSFLFFFTVQILLRSIIMRHHLPFETLFLGTLTSPSFFLFTFFMITDPATSPNGRNQQIWAGFWLATLDLVLHLRHSYYTFFYAALILASTRLAMNHYQALKVEGFRQWWRGRFFESGYYRQPLALGLIAVIGIGVYQKWLRPVVAQTETNWTLESVSPEKSGMDVGVPSDEVYGRVDERVEHVAKWVLSIGDALATGDVDGDGRMDVFATQMLKGDAARNTLWRNVSKGPGDVRFEKIEMPALASNTVRYDREGLVLGATFVDFDNDGDLDLWLMVAFGQSRLLKNELIETGVLSFADVTEAVGLQNNTRSMAAAWSDLDRDGRLDLILANVWPENLPDYAGPANLNFFDLPKPAHSGDRRMFEFMHDSWHLSNNGGENLVFLQKQSGKFVRDPVWRLPETRWSLSVSTADLNRDGWPDLYVANDFGPDDLYFNLKGQGWKRIEGTMFGSIGRDTYKGMNSTIADFDRNGWQDVYVSNVHHSLQAEGSLLWLFGPAGEGKGHMGVQITDEATVRGVLNENRFGWGAAAGDLDNDGWMDLVQTNGMVDDSVDKRFDECPDYWYVNEKIARSAPSTHRFADKWGDIRGACIYGKEQVRAYMNRGTKSVPQFVDVANQIGLTETSPSRAAALVDLDRDGRLDVLIARQFKSTQVLRNVGGVNSKTGNWIGLKLVGDPVGEREGCNRQAIGSKVTVQGLTQEVQLTNGLSSQGDGELHFGLGETGVGRNQGRSSASSVATVQVEVAWCGHAEPKTYQLAIGQRHILEQRPGKGSKRLAGPSKQGDQI